MLYARPKSAIFRESRDLSKNRIFSGFRSLCIMLWECMNSSPSSSYRMTCLMSDRSKSVYCFFIMLSRLPNLREFDTSSGELHHQIVVLITNVEFLKSQDIWMIPFC